MLTATRVRNRFQWQLLAATAMPWAVLLVLGAADLPHSVGATALLTGALGTPHVATTFLFYGDGEMRDHLRAHPLRYLIAPAALVVGGAAWGFAAPDLVLQAGIVGLVVWQLHHFTRQNLGVFSFVCRSRGVPGPSDRERQAIKLTGYAAMLGIATEIHPLGVDIPGAALLGHLGLVVLVAAVLALAAVVYRRLGFSDCPDNAEHCIMGVGAKVVCTSCMDERAFGGPDA